MEFHSFIHTILYLRTTQSCPTLFNLMDYTVNGILQAGILEGVAFPFSRGASQPRSPTLQADSLPSEPPGKPKNTGVGSLSLLHGVFPTQVLNWSLPHCRQIFYQLSYQGSPKKQISVFKYRYKLRRNNHTHILKSNYCNVPILCYSGLCLIVSVTVFLGLR